MTEATPPDDLTETRPESWQEPAAPRRPSLMNRLTRAAQAARGPTAPLVVEPMPVPDGSFYRTSALVLGIGSIGFKIINAFLPDSGSFSLFPWAVFSLLLLIVSEIRDLRAEAILMERRRRAGVVV